MSDPDSAPQIVLPVAVVTGASRGIGRAVAEHFLALGWEVMSCSREDVPPSARAHANWTLHVAADLMQPADQQRFVQAVLAQLAGRPLAALVNNAGISPKTPYKERLGCLNGDFAGWYQVFELNFFAPLKLARGLAAPLARGKGAIVNVTSIAGHAIHPFAGSAYSTSKAALSGLTREMAAEFAQLGVRVNAVAPGEIETAMVGPEYETLIPRIPMGRMGTVQDCADVIYYLCSPQAGYVTGTEIFITGGQHLG